MDQEAYSELSLRELRVLDALLHQRSITRTAQSMETTQPAISKVLRSLRAQFSDPLFVRNGQAMQPTARALDIADRLRVLLAAADGLRSAVTPFDPASSDRLFSLLLTDVGMIRFLPPLIARMAAIAPNISVRAVPLDARQFEYRLETGEADLAFWRVSESRAPSAAAAPVFRRLFERATQASSARVEIPVAVGLSRRASHTGDGIGDRARRASYGAACAVFRHRSCEHHVARAELYRRRHRCGGDRRHCNLAGQSGATPCRPARPCCVRTPDRTAAHRDRPVLARALSP
jgi:DNA-binding transcriptional LysR family regulator